MANLQTLQPSETDKFKIVAAIRQLNNFANAPTVGGASIQTYYDTRAAAIAADLSAYSTGDRIETLNYATAGDGGGGIYEKVASLGSGTGYFTSADGSFWGLAGPVIHVAQFGALHDTANDGSILSTTPLNDAISFCNANGSISVLQFGGYIYAVNAALTAFTRNIELRGAPTTSLARTIIMKRYVEASSFAGVLTFGRWMPRIINMGFAAASGSGGSMVTMINPADTASAGNCYLEDCSFSTGDFCNFNLYIDGGANDVAPLGARNIFMTNCEFFGCATASAKLNGVRNVHIADTTFDLAGGTGTTALWLLGDSGVASNNFLFFGNINDSIIEDTTDAIFVGSFGDLTLENIDNIEFHGIVRDNITNTSNCTNTRIIGRILGTVENDWDYTNQIIDGSAGRADSLSFKVSVNFNSANTDTAIPIIIIPAGFTRYRVERVTVSGASASITTATAGLFTAAAGGGTAIVTAASAMTVSTASEDTVNNMQVMSVNGQNTTSYTDTSLFWRVATAQGSAATATVEVTINPVS